MYAIHMNFSHYVNAREWILPLHTSYTNNRRSQFQRSVLIYKRDNPHPLFYEVTIRHIGNEDPTWTEYFTRKVINIKLFTRDELELNTQDVLELFCREFDYMVMLVVSTRFIVEEVEEQSINAPQVNDSTVYFITICSTLEQINTNKLLIC